MFKYSKAQMITVSMLFLVVISITAILFFALSDKDEKLKKIPQKIVTILIIVSEIIKYSLILSAKNYSLLYPSYYCSFLWFWLLFADFTKGRFADSCEAISLCGSFSVTVLMIISPTSIIGDSVESLFSSYLSFHHLLFHGLVILHLSLALFLKTFKIKKSYFLYVFIWVMILCAVIIPRAYIASENCMNVLTSPISILESIRLQFGQIIYDIILVGLLLFVLETISAVFYLSYAKLSKKEEVLESDAKVLDNK